MKKIILLALMLLFATVVSAQYNISVEGQLVYSNGSLITGDHDVTFILYNSSDVVIFNRTYSSITLDNQSRYFEYLNVSYDFSDTVSITTTIDTNAESSKSQIGYVPYAVNAINWNGSDNYFTKSEVYTNHSSVGYFNTEGNLTDLLDDNYIASGTSLGNSTAEILNAVNNTALNGSEFVSIQCSNIVFDNGVGSAGICDGDDAAGAGSYDLNISSDSGNGVITDSEVFTLTGAGSVSTAISGNEITITGTDTTGGNSTDEIRAAVNATVTYQFNISCSNVQGATSNLCTLTDTDTDTDTTYNFNRTDLFNHSNGNVGFNYTTLNANFVGQNEYPNLDTDSTDDFDGAYDSLTGAPTYFSNFTDDVGYYYTEANLTALLDDNYIAAGTSLGNSTQEILTAVNQSTYSYVFNISCDNIEGATSNLCTLVDTDTQGGNSTQQIRDAVNSSVGYAFNAATATALEANGGNCAAGSYPLGVDASGAVEDCTDATTEIDSAIATHAGTAHGNSTAEIKAAIDGEYPNLDTDSTDDFSGSYNDLSDKPANIDEDSTDDVTIGSANQTLVYCGNVTGATSDLCSLVDTQGGNSTEEIQAVAVGGEVSGTVGSITLDDTALDDAYVELGDNFAGDVTGTYDATVVGDDTHQHACQNITGAASDLCTITDTQGGNSTQEIRDAINASVGYQIDITGTLDGYEASALLDNTDAQTLSYANGNITISGSNDQVNISDVDTVLTEAQVDAYADNNNYVDTDDSPNVDLDSTNDVTIGSANLTLVYCGNVTGATSNLCTITDTQGGNSTQQIRDAVNSSVGYDFNAATATALEANGANCDAGSYPLGVDASGAAESCTDATTEIDSAIATHAATKHGNSTTEIQAVAVGGEVTGTVGSITIDDNALDDQYYDSEGDLTALLDDNYVAAGTSLGNSTEEMQTAINVTDITYNFSIKCENIDGNGGDSDFCNDATGAGGGGNSTEEMQDAVWESGIGTTTGIAVTYQDGSNNVDFVVTVSDSNATTACSGTTTYLDGEGNCDDISGVYVQAGDWTTIDNYPAACGAGEYVNEIGDTLTCTDATTEIDSAIATHAGTAHGNSTEQIQDAVWDGGIGTTSGITVTYQDSTNDVDFEVTVSDSNASTACSGSTTYLDGEGNCDDISGVYVQASDWTTIDDYPSDCTAGQYVSGLGDTLTCSTPAGGGGGNSSEEMVIALNNTEGMNFPSVNGTGGKGYPIYFTCGENQALDNTAQEWSCGGNGETGQEVYIAEDMILTDVGMDCNTNTGTAVVQIRKNLADSGCSLTHTNHHDTTTCSASFSAGDWMQPYTVSDTGHSQCVITMRFITN